MTGRQLAGRCAHTAGTVCVCALVAVAVTIVMVVLTSALAARVAGDQGGVPEQHGDPIMTVVPA